MPARRSCGTLGLPAFAQPLRSGGACWACAAAPVLLGVVDPTEVGRQRKVRSVDRVPRPPRLRARVCMQLFSADATGGWAWVQSGKPWRSACLC